MTIATTKFKKLLGQRRNIYSAKNRPIESSDYNMVISSFSADLSSLTNQWNNLLFPLLGSLPGGNVRISTRTSNINPIENGLDGTQVFLDILASEDTDEGKWYNTQLHRPSTIKEGIEGIETRLGNEIDELSSQFSQIDLATGLTIHQKEAIGYNIFDTALSSTPDSLDGITHSLLNNINQLAADVWNLGGAAGDPNSYHFTGRSQQSLSPSIRDLINTNAGEIASLWGETWAQDKVTGLEDDLTDIHNAIQLVSGTAGMWNTLPADPTGGASSLLGHMLHIGGDGATPTNPHGLTLDDIGDWLAKRADIYIDINQNESRIFNIRNNLLGSSDFSSMAFEDTSIVLSNDTVKEAIEALDRAITTIESVPIVNCTSIEEPDGARTDFTIAYPIAYDEIPLESGYPWMPWITYIFDLSAIPISVTWEPGTTSIYFSDTTIFATEITGSLPANPGEYVVGYSGIALPAGLDYGEVAVMSPIATTDPGTASYYSPIPGQMIIQDSIEVYINGVHQFRFRDFRENWVGNYATSLTLTTAPLATDTLGFNCNVPASLIA